MTETTTDTLNGRYTGAIGAFFWLNFRLGLLTLITLGLYRFWARTRVRRYMWSATSPGGDPFEYTGTGLEKLLGHRGDNNPCYKSFGRVWPLENFRT